MASMTRPLGVETHVRTIADANSETQVYWSQLLGAIFVLRLLYTSVNYYRLYCRGRPALTPVAATAKKVS